jgi:hypothetical protein
VHRATPSERPIIQQLKRRPDASNIEDESESNEDRYWSGELSAVHDNLQVAIPKDGGQQCAGRSATRESAFGAGAFIQM